MKTGSKCAADQNTFWDAPDVAERTRGEWLTTLRQAQA